MKRFKSDWLKSKGIVLPKRKPVPRGRSKLELQFENYWQLICGPPLVTEHQFHPQRRWRFDFAHLSTLIAVEIEGGNYSGGGHTRGKHFAQDCEKYLCATLMGWTVIRLTGDMITTGNLENIKKLMLFREGKR